MKTKGLLNTLVWLGVILSLGSGSLALGQGTGRTPAEERLATVRTWFYYITVDIDGDVLDQVIESDYDMVVIDPVITEQQNEDFDIVGTVRALQESGKIVLAYMDVGQAEDYRTYWQEDWRIGDPAWLVGADPDGWVGNYPVAFWWDEWQAIWHDPDQGLLQLILDSGFDGIYMDWVEAYSDENVIAVAEVDDVDPAQEIIWYVEGISEYTKARREDFIVVAQNAAELAEYDDYLAVIDGIAQEQTWFDGAPDGRDPEGDCPLPATDADIDTDAYRESLSEPCLAHLDDEPDSPLHVSTEEYLYYLTLARDKGEIILTVDYALEPQNVAWVYETSRAFGFVPFVGARALDRYTPAVP